MRRLLMAILAVGAAATAPGPAFAHHSMAIYNVFADTIEGTVQEFRYVNPHSILVLQVKTRSGGTKVWHLEGEAPAALSYAGFSRNTFRRGDRLRLLVHQFRSGQAGGRWSIRTVIMRNGHEFEGHQCLSSADRCVPQP